MQQGKHLMQRFLASLSGWQVAAAVVVFFLVAAASFGFFSYQRIFVSSDQAGRSGVLSATPSPAATPPPPVYTIALLGHGGAGHDGALLTDSIMVIKIDTGLQTVGLISVPRDSWVQLPVQGWDNQTGWKVNAAYAIGSSDGLYPKKPAEFTGEAGGGTMAKYALEQITGFPIDYFVALDFTGFKKAIDVLGGITVYVDRTFDDYLYPIPGEEENDCGRTAEDIEAITATMSATQIENEQIFGCRYEHLHFDRGSTLLDGETALKFVRSRHAAQDGGDFNRAARQRKVILAVKEKVLAINFIPKAVPFLNSLTYNLKLDIPLDQLKAWIDQREQFLSYEIVGVALTADQDNVLELTTSSTGQSILLPRERESETDWSSVHRFIQEQLMATSSADL